MTPLRLLFLCGGSLVSGLEIMALSVMRGLLERGNDVFCVRNGWNNGDFGNRLREGGIPSTSLFFGKFSKSLRFRPLWDSANAAVHLPGARRSFTKLLRRYRPDVLVAYNRDSLLLTADLLKRYPVVFHVHELADATRAARWIYSRLDSVVDAYAPVSNHLGRRLLALGIPDQKIAVIHNGIPPVSATSQPSRTGRSLTVGIVGQVGPWKGHEDLFEALWLLKAEGYGLQCAVFGAGAPDYVARLRRIAEEYGISQNIQWRGFVKQPDEIYSCIDVCVMPSRIEEAFGLAAAEAGARGIPVIATRRGGLAEIVRDGETGYLVNDSSPAEIADRLRRLADDAQLRSRLGARAREYVLGQFSERQMIDNLEALCRRVRRGDGTAAPALTMNA